MENYYSILDSILTLTRAATDKNGGIAIHDITIPIALLYPDSNLSDNEHRELLNKLIMDGYIADLDSRNIVFKITFAGYTHLDNGGYVSQKKKEKRNRYVKVFVACVGVIGGIFAIISETRDLFHPKSDKTDTIAQPEQQITSKTNEQSQDSDAIHQNERKSLKDSILKKQNSLHTKDTGLSH